MLGDVLPQGPMCVCLFSVCRRSVIEAVYNKLNPHREEEGVSLMFSKLPPSSTPSKHTHTKQDIHLCVCCVFVMQSVLSEDG